MITVISGTNRKGSRTKKVAEKVFEILQGHVTEGTDLKFLALEDMPMDWFSGDMYADYSTNFTDVQKDILEPSKKFIFVLPEYNGSFPGALKMMIDASTLETCFHGKSCAMIGVAAGRAGNLRGMDHLTNVMHHIKVSVLPNKLPISAVHTLMNEAGELEDDATEKAITTLINGLIQF